MLNLYEQRYDFKIIKLCQTEAHTNILTKDLFFSSRVVAIQHSAQL